MKKKTIKVVGLKISYLILIYFFLNYIHQNNLFEEHKWLLIIIYGIIFIGGFSLIDWYKKK